MKQNGKEIKLRLYDEIQEKICKLQGFSSSRKNDERSQKKYCQKNA